MAQPDIGTFAQRVYDQLAPVAAEDESNDWALANYLGALGQGFQEIEDYASDGPDDEAGWSGIMDIDRAPQKGLGWLAQFVGVRLQPNADDLTQRAWIRTRQGWQRGTPAAMRAAAQQYLAGTKTVYFLERDTDPYHMTIYTLAGETPADPITGSPALVLSGNEITDATRVTNVQGDSLPTPDSSYGIWEGRTNLFTNGSIETNTTGWSPSFATISRDNTRFKFGSWSLKIVTDGLAGSGTKEGAQFGLVNISASTYYTVSFWVFAPAGTRLMIRVDEQDASNVFLRSNLSPQFTTSGSWQRFSYTFTTGVNTAKGLFYFRTSENAPAQAVTWWLDGAQLEQGRFASPYIHTDGATATRSVAHVGAPAALISPTQGWIAARVRMGASSADQVAAANEEPGIFGWGAWYNGYRVLFSGGLWMFQRARGPTSSPWNGIGINIGGSWNAGDYVTIVAAWTADRLKFSINGAAFQEVLGTQIPALADLPSTFNVGEQAVGGQMLDGEMLWFAAGKGTLSSADAADIHAAAILGGKLWKDMPANSVPTFLWGADNASYTMAGSSARILAALLAQKPAGIVMTYGTTSGQDYAAIFATRATYAALFGAYATYQAVLQG